MTERRDDFDLVLTERLGATEHRVPGASPPPAKVPERSALRRVVVGTAAAAALVVGVLLYGGLPSSEVADATPTATSLAASASASETPASEAPTPTSTPARESLAPLPAWTDVLEFGDPVGQVVAGPVAHGSAGFIAFGATWEGFEGGPRPTKYWMWRSIDGITWTEAPFPDVFGTIPVVTTAADGSWVAFEPTNERAPDSNLGHPAWESRDGVTWVAFDSGIPNGLAVESIAAGRLGYVLNAYDLAGGEPGCGCPSIWFSADGKRWEMVQEFEAREHWYDVEDVGAGDEGFVVLGSTTSVDDHGYQRFASASADGHTWFDSLEPFGPDDQRYRPRASVTGFGPDWIAAVGERDRPTQVWRSANGLEWTRAGSIPSNERGYTTLLAFVGGELLYAPADGYFLEGEPGAWTSETGETWARIGVPENSWFSAVVEGRGLVALTGSTPIGDGSTPGIWVRPVR
jgi:hypothetical protein